jgi:hypothetical protein
MQILTENQRREMQQTGELHLLDPQTQQEYVAVKAELYNKIKKLVYDDSEWSEYEIEGLAARTFDELENPEKIQ